MVTDMKILVFSDSHGVLNEMCAAIDAEEPDYVIHLGDHIRDAEALMRFYPQLPVRYVRGNCDLTDYTALEMAVVMYGNVRIMMCHGHRYGVKNSLLRLTMAAKEQAADVVLFGHTHCPYCEEYDNLWLVNPGAAGHGCYGIVEVIGQKISCQIKQKGSNRED